MSEFANYWTMREELWEKYPYKVIALCDGKVIASGETYMEVLMKAHKKVGKKRFMVHRVGPLKESIAIL